MNIAILNKKKRPFKQLSFILTILLLLFTFSFACSPAVNPRDNNVELTVFTPSRHIKVSDGSTDITDSLSIGVNNSNLISITGLNNTVAANKTYTLTITPVTGVFSTQGDSLITITITEPQDFSPGDGVLSPSDSFTITNVNDESKPISYTLEVPFSGAPVEDWLTSDSLSTYITATFASQAASLTLSKNTLSVNDLLNADSGTGSISFTLPTGFVANPESITLPDPDGSAITAATIIPSSSTFTIRESDNTKNSQTYTIDTISLAAITAFTPSRHIKITDDSIMDSTLNDITDTLTIDVNNTNLITISGLSNAVTDKNYTLTIAPVADLFSTSSGADITITITEPDGFSPGYGVLSSSDSFTITNVSDPSNSISYTVVVPFVGAAINEWLTETTFATYFTGATYAGQTLDSGALSFNFDGDSIAIDGSSIFNLQDGSLLLTTNIADVFTLTQNLIDPDGDGVAALTDADAESITITEEGNPANTKTYTITISLAAYTSPVEASHVTAMFNGITARPSNIEISGADIIISGFPNIAGSTGSGSVSITPTTGYIIDPDPLSLSFTDPDGTDSQDMEAGTVSVTSAGLTALHTIIIRFSTLIELKIISDNIPSGTVTILKGDTVTLTDLGACELLPPPTFEIVGNSSATVRGFPSYFDRRIDNIPTGSDSYTLNRVLILEDATGVLDDNYIVSIEGFPACDDGTIFTNSGKTGEEANPYEIDSAPKLELLSHLVRTDNANFASKSYKLTADIDLGLAGLPWSEEASGETGEGFPPIGLTDTKFQGTFDCADYSISNLYINKANDNYIGLFGYGSGASIQNCSLINVNVTGADSVGGLVGFINSDSNITNSYATGSVSGTSRVGGLAGYLKSSSSITNSYATGDVEGTNNVGNLAGFLFSSSISNSYATGSVSGNDYVGGLAGVMASTSRITNSYATGSILGTSRVGGLAGSLDGSNITDSYATGSVSGDSEVGGLVGYLNSSSSISNSYATGSVSGTGQGIGGLVGWVSSSSITNSYASGTVSGTGSAVGGLAGYLKGRENSTSITNSYATGDVEGTNNVGLFIGYNGDDSPPITIVYTGVTDSYYNNEAVLSLITVDADTGATSTNTVAAKGVGSDGETSDTTTLNLTGLDKSTLRVAKGSTAGEPYSTWLEDVWLFMAGQYPRLITVACPNRQYPADPSNVPTDCTAL